MATIQQVADRQIGAFRLPRLKFVQYFGRVTALGDMRGWMVYSDVQIRKRLPEVFLP